jgi:TRAP-type C4-dicarboxylate transport system permease small subunit
VTKTATQIVANMSLWLGGICMAVMAIMTVADVFMRYVFLSPLPGTSEHTQLLMALIVFSGLVLVTREGTHIVVSLFETTINRLVPKLYDRIYFVANVFGLGLIIYAMIMATRDMYEFEEETLVMEYPLVYLGGIVVLLLVLAFAQLKHLAKHGPSGHEQLD